ncbi:peptide/nickel transport system permease protein [Tamaricihabitans halophyticus]|uniref:Peptide/nickel transport system permease protein n=1 Tax=Tamaricihabitans halophyticus TaxID=1262583 RepID=A0A4R2QN92_9PSEU|nr:ABC transporter permease [Tamaricihabitans halophyticus]TCP50068.1 peptide/nickel transport system permease protein [Tamaricihabitans halophyticus]
MTTQHTGSEPGSAAGGTEEISGPALSGRARFWRRFRRQWPAQIALGYLIVIVAVAVCAPLLATYSPFDQNLNGVLARPSGEHWLGTDDLGRDVYSRLLYAARISLLAAAQAVAVSLVLGVLPGLLAGYAGKKTDAVIMRITDAVMSFPPLILAIAVVGVLGPSLTNAMFVIGIIFAPRFLRLVRGSVLSLRAETFIEASRSIGTPRWRIIQRHVLPNVLSPLVVQISLASALAMLAEASLSFLGLGVQPPEASWGAMIERGFRYTAAAPWMTVFPGLLIALTVLAFNVLGDGLRDSLGREVRKAS